MQHDLRRRHSRTTRGILLLAGLTLATAGCGGPQGRERSPHDRSEFSEDAAADLTHRRELFGSHDEYVDPFTGELFVTHTDMVLPGPAGLDLEVTRTLRSGAGNVSTALGAGWQLHFGQADLDDFCDFGRPRVFTLADGTRQYLVPGIGEDAGTYMSGDRYNGRCEDGVPVVYSPQGIRYELEDVGDDIGMVRRISDPHGNWIELDNEMSYGDLSDGEDYEHPVHYPIVRRATASDGREVVFDYVRDPGARWNRDRPDRLVAVRSTDPVTGAERRWRYQYQDEPWSHQDPTADQGVTAFLVAVERPDGAEWTFEPCRDVEAGHGDPDDRMCHLGLAITHPGGTTTSYDYGAYRDSGGMWVNLGKVEDKRRVDPVTGDLDHWSFEYKDKDWGRRTRISGPDGTIEYVHDTIHSTGTGENWKVGTLASRRILDHAGQELETAEYTWGSQQISDSKFTVYSTGPHGFGRTDDQTYAPVLNRMSITREGTTWVTEYDEHDAYGNAQRRTEYREDLAGEPRISHRSFVHLRGPWIVARMQDEAVDGAGSIERQFDERGKLVRETRFGLSTERSYHPDGELHTVTDPEGHTTRYEGYRRGLPQTVVRSDGLTEQYALNGAGTIGGHVDADGFATAITYDGLNRPIHVDLPQYADIEFSYPDANTAVQVRGAYRETLRYDGQGRLIRRERDSGDGTLVVEYELDHAGRTVFESYPFYADDPQGGMRGTHFEYDALGRIVAETEADGSERRWSYAGHVVVYTDEDGHQTVRHYRAWGEPDEGVVEGIQSPEGVVTTIGRDVRGEVQWVQQDAQGSNRPQLRRTFEYNEHRQLVRRQDPERGLVEYVRDDNGRILEARIEGGAPTQHEYDPMGREIRTVMPSGEVTEREYDGRGNLVQLDNDVARRSYVYDGAGGLLRETLEVDGQHFSVDYPRDGLGHRSEVHYPSGRIVNLAPDTMGRATRAGSLISALEHHPSGRLSRIEFVSGVHTTIGEDDRGRVTSIHTAGPGGVLVDLRYGGYDGRGNPGTITDPTHPERDLTLAYDGLSRLTGAQGFWGSSSYGYDARGNLVSRSRAGAEESWGLSDGVHLDGMDYDGRGNLRSMPGLTLEFDSADRLRQATNAGGETVTYDYDGAGMLVRQHNGGQVTYYVYTAAERLLGQYEADGTPVREWLEVDGHKLGVLTPAGDVALHLDALGSPISATSMAGAVFGEEGYFPFGQRRELNDLSATTQGAAWFTGKLEDPTTGLVYHGARWYHPGLGRFLSVDPAPVALDNAHSFNRYAYANNNPYRFIDPDGRQAAAVDDASAPRDGGWSLSDALAAADRGAGYVGNMLNGAIDEFTEIPFTDISLSGSVRNGIEYVTGLTLADEDSITYGVGQDVGLAVGLASVRGPINAIEEVSTLTAKAGKTVVESVKYGDDLNEAAEKLGGIADRAAEAAEAASEAEGAGGEDPFGGWGGGA